MLKAGLLFLLVFGIEMVGDVAEDHEWNRRVQGYPLGREGSNQIKRQEARLAIKANQGVKG